MDFTYQGRHPPSQLAAMVAQTNASLDQEPWYAGSGANNHITGAFENLSLQAPCNGSDNVTVGNGSTLKIAHTISTTITTPSSCLKLNNIFHCPSAAANLLSINRFARDNNCHFILTSTHFFVKDNKTRQTLLQGRSEHGLYPIHLERSFSNKLRKVIAFLGIHASSSIWHNRLGHPAPPILKQLRTSHQLPITGPMEMPNLCEPCQVAKGKRLPLSLSTRVSTCPLELVHSDVWSSPILSISGYKYYVTFIDDFSRFTWLFPLRFKSDVFSCFVKFKSLVENLFSCKLKYFQTDGGGEYSKNEFQHLEKNGIMHRLSSPKTLQQNGVAERKHRHIVDTGLALLAHSHLPFTY